MSRVGLLALALAAACVPRDITGPAPPVPLGAVLGTWTFQVQDNATCTGAAHVGSITVHVSQTQEDVSFGGTLLWLENATSTWIGPAADMVGYVTGWISLSLPGSATFNLVQGSPVNGTAPSPVRIATIAGAVAPDLTFTGMLTDPSAADTSFRPIFSTGSCTYQAAGRHQ